ncbi:MAG: DUF3798 domain-containing protein [Deltaproteobacteria bacterium]|jgi:DNA-binding LacI/PurR family transcriptional regulator|nr:DUF3798 domain-containing protein [Deltaproteobacteria bacterium]
MPTIRGKRAYFLIVAAAIVAAVAGYFCFGSDPEEDVVDKRRARRAASEMDESLAPRASQSRGQRTPGGSSWPKPSNIKEDFHIGVVTGSGVFNPEELAPVRALENLYGQADQGGRIRHVALPENFLVDLETGVDRIEELAADPLMRAIVVNEAIPGTAEAFRKIREKRPEIFLLAAESHEDLALIAGVADVVVDANFLARGYLIARSAKELGAKTLVHISFPRHMLSEPITRRKALLRRACQELGLTFVDESAPDPLSEVGLKGAQDYILEAVPKWLEKYGPQTAFFSTNNAHAAPLIRQVVKTGGYFIEGDIPSPLLGFPEALNLDILSLGRDWLAITSLIEKALIHEKALGRLASWPTSTPYVHTAALVEFAKALALGEAKKDDFRTLIGFYEKYSQGSRWRGDWGVESQGQILNNVLLVFQDTYVYGLGPLGNLELETPAPYSSMAKDHSYTTVSPYQIGVVTGTAEQGGEDLLGALEMEKRYGQAEKGGMIKRLTYGDDYLENPDSTAALIASLAEEPLIKVVVVNQAIEGTAEGFRRIKAKRPDIFCLAAEPFEEADVITATADLAIATDFISRGYLIPYSAKTLGAETLVHLSFPRHMEIEGVKRRSDIMAQASKDLGINYVLDEVLDPVGPQGSQEAIKSVSRVVGELLAKHGPKTAFFCTNDLLTTPLIKEVAEKGGFFVEADIPSPLLGYPQAFSLDIEPFLGQWNLVLKKVEEAVVAAGAGGRLGAWSYPLGFSQTAGLVEFGRLLAENRALISDTPVFLETLDNLSPGSNWNGSYLNDPKSGKPWRNFFLVYQDTYVFGRGYIETTKIDVPIKYYE